jgi:hypothetical protein
VLVAVLGVAPGAAVAAPAPAAPRDRGDVWLGARVGASFADAWSKLGPSFVVGLEGGWALPRWRHRVALALDVAFTAPALAGSGGDPQLGNYTFRVDAREVIVGASIIYRHPIRRVVPYVGLGPRLVIVDAHEQGSAGMARLPATSDLGVGGGGGGFVGIGVHLGPGELFVDARADAAPVHDVLTGSFVAGAIFVAAGYRVVFNPAF